MRLSITLALMMSGRQLQEGEIKPESGATAF
jgi:hypothetical protein